VLLPGCWTTDLKQKLLAFGKMSRKIIKNLNLPNPSGSNKL